jgi:hypothetical protein
MGVKHSFGLITGLGGVPLNLQFSRLYELSVNKDCSVEEMARVEWEEGGNG